MKKKEIKNKSEKKITWQTINKGKAIYFEDVKHWIVMEFEDSILIARNEDLTNAFCVSKTKLSH